MKQAHYNPKPPKHFSVRGMLRYFERLPVRSQPCDNANCPIAIYMGKSGPDSYECKVLEPRLAERFDSHPATIKTFYKSFPLRYHVDSWAPLKAGSIAALIREHLELPV